MERLREDGFTIIEVLVASLIMVLGVLPPAEAATRNTTRAKDTQVVLNIAQQEMEKLRALPTWTLR